MHFSRFVRRSHRWVSMAFTLTVVANFAARARGEPPPWLTYAPLLPLLLLLVSGLYLFVLPHVGAGRNTPHPNAELRADKPDRT